MIVRNDNVLVEPIVEKETRNKMGIVISNNNSDVKYKRGKVISIGSGKLEGSTRIPISELAVGDIVVFNYFLEYFNTVGEKYYIVREDDILAVDN